MEALVVDLVAQAVAKAVALRHGVGIDEQL